MINAFFFQFWVVAVSSTLSLMFPICRILFFLGGCFGGEAVLFSRCAPVGLVLVLACRVCFSLSLGCFGVPICRRSIAFLFHWFRVRVLSPIFDVAWCRIAIFFPQGCSSSLSLPGSAVLGWFAPTQSSRVSRRRLIIVHCSMLRVTPGFLDLLCPVQCLRSLLAFWAAFSQWCFLVSAQGVYFLFSPR